MPQLWTRTLIPTLRDAPGDAEVPSHRLLLRAGYVRKLGSGSYTYLPLGLRVLDKVMRIIREEMAAAGASEIFMPTLQPVELWERTGRRAAYGENLFVVTDRHGREQALGPTHEEVVTELVGSTLASYKDLPRTVYQIQTKFRDEFRPRFGVLRSREFLMKDAYSFHLGLEGPGGLDEEYDKQYAAYQRIFDRCGIPYLIVEAEAGPIGGNASHEFMVPSPTGEDTILMNDAGYAANVEKCETGVRPHDVNGQPTGDLEEVHTPDCPSIADVCTFFKKQLGSKLSPKNMLKTLVLKALFDGEHARWVLAVIRGDHDLNLVKARSALAYFDPVLGTLDSLEIAPESEARDKGFNIGFVGPQVFVDRNLLMLVDPDAFQSKFWVAGLNKVDCHVKHFDWSRDVLSASEARFSRQTEGVRAKGDLDAYFASGFKSLYSVADIRNAVEGDPAPAARGGGTLRATKGIEVGHVFKLGDKYTKALGVTVTDEHNQPVTPIMGCYGIGVNRILAAAIESAPGSSRGETGTGPSFRGGHDADGIVWPAALAPYHVVITPIKYEGTVKDAVDHLTAALEASVPGTADAPGAADVNPSATPADTADPLDIAAELVNDAAGLLGRVVSSVTDAVGDSPPEAGASDTEPTGLHPRPQRIEVLIDDRDERPGVKFKDADLIGIPVRITVGDKGLSTPPEAGGPTVEIKARDGRTGPKGEVVKLADAAARVRELLDA